MNRFCFTKKNIVFLNPLVVLLLCIFTSACTESDSTNGANETKADNSVVKAKVEIPEGLTFTNEMLILGPTKDGTVPNDCFNTKEKILGKKAKHKIAQDKVITLDDIAKDEEEEDEETKTSENASSTQTESEKE